MGVSGRKVRKFTNPEHVALGCDAFGILLEFESVLEFSDTRMELQMGELSVGIVRCKRVVGKRSCRNGIYSGNGGRTRNSTDGIYLSDGYS